MTENQAARIINLLERINAKLDRALAPPLMVVTSDVTPAGGIMPGPVAYSVPAQTVPAPTGFSRVSMRQRGGGGFVPDDAA